MLGRCCRRIVDLQDLVATHMSWPWMLQQQMLPARQRPATGPSSLPVTCQPAPRYKAQWWVHTSHITDGVGWLCIWLWLSCVCNCLAKRKSCKLRLQLMMHKVQIFDKPVSADSMLTPAHVCRKS